MAFVLNYDVNQVKRMLERLPEELRDKTMAMAINKTADKAYTKMKKEIANYYNVKQAEVGGSLFISKASAKFNVISASLYPTSLMSQLYHKSRAMNVIHFLEKKTTGADAKRRRKAGTLTELFFKFKKRGGSVNIKAERGYSTPFIGNEGRTVFRRTGEDPRTMKRGKNKGKVREPIDSVKVIGLGQMFNTKAVNQPVLEKAAEDLLVETQRAVDLMLSRLNT